MRPKKHRVLRKFSSQVDRTIANVLWQRKEGPEAEKMNYINHTKQSDRGWNIVFSFTKWTLQTAECNVLPPEPHEYYLQYTAFIFTVMTIEALRKNTQWCSDHRFTGCQAEGRYWPFGLELLSLRFCGYQLWLHRVAMIWNVTNDTSNVIVSCLDFPSMPLHQTPAPPVLLPVMCSSYTEKTEQWLICLFLFTRLTKKKTQHWGLKRFGTHSPVSFSSS